MNYKFGELFERLGLSLNIAKCKVMTLTRIHSPLTFSYHLLNADILRYEGHVILVLCFPVVLSRVYILRLFVVLD